jgi:hypothetical protein
VKITTILALILLLLSGCDSLESTSDQAAKIALIGSWYVEFKDPSERRIKYLTNLDVSRSFTAKQKIDGEAQEEKSSGRWYVTEGLLKLHTNEIAGKKLGSLDSLYLTCKLDSLEANAFSCEQGINKLKLSFRRVASDFKIE